MRTQIKKICQAIISRDKFVWFRSAGINEGNYFKYKDIEVYFEPSVVELRIKGKRINLTSDEINSLIAACNIAMDNMNLDSLAYVDVVL